MAYRYHSEGAGEQVGGNTVKGVCFSLEAYIATRSKDIQRSTSKLVQLCAHSELWTVVTDSLATRCRMGPCRMQAGFLLRHSDGKIAAAIVAKNWSVILVGEEAWVDVAATDALAASLVGTPVREKIEIPFLSPSLTVRATAKVGEFHRFYCD